MRVEIRERELGKEREGKERKGRMEQVDKKEKGD